MQNLNHCNLLTPTTGVLPTIVALDSAKAFQSSVNMSSIGDLASSLLLLEAPQKAHEKNGKRPTQYAIVYWIETKEFNVMPLSKIPKDKREEGALATLRAEGKEWATKIVKVGGKKTSSARNHMLDFKLKACNHYGTQQRSFCKYVCFMSRKINIHAEIRPY